MLVEERYPVLSVEELKQIRITTQKRLEAAFGKNKFFIIGDKKDDHTVVYFWRVGSYEFAIRSAYVQQLGAPTLVKIELGFKANGGYEYIAAFETP